MSRLNLELDEKMAALEAEWRQVYEASVAARAELDRLRDGREADGRSIDFARSKLQSLEVMKARVMQKIERLEQSLSTDERC